MREPTYFILLALHAEPLHGYGIIKKADLLSSGRVRLTAGTLYGALDRLVDDGLLEVDREETVNGRRRRYYRITEYGRHETGLEAQRMRSVVEASERVIGRLPNLGSTGATS